jgi:hypothetical protein
MLNVPAYLRRINYTGPAAPTPAALREIHRAHLFAVPFENLDIHLGRKIVCDEDAFLHKIVNERRGGFCYELNGGYLSKKKRFALRGMGAWGCQNTPRLQIWVNYVEAVSPNTSTLPRYDCCAVSRGRT